MNEKVITPIIARKKPHFFILFLLMSFASVGAVFYTPALPAITQYFGVTQGVAQLTMILYLVGFAVGQLCYGPISNRYGRKPVIIVGIVIAIISTLGCALSGYFHSFYMLLFFRITQALGMCVGMMMTFTMVADYYPKKTAHMNALLMLSLASLPPLSAVLGGFVVQHINWQACFYFLTAYSIILLLLSLLLPETAPQIDPHALKIKNLLFNYLSQFNNKQFLLYAITMGCVTSVIYLFASEAPFIGVHVMQLKPSVYGILFLLSYLGMAMGSLASWYLARLLKLTTIMKIGMGVMLLFSVIMLIYFALGWINIFSLFILSMFIYAGEMMVFPNAAAAATGVSANKSNASAVMNFFNIGISVLTVMILSLITSERPVILPLLFVILILIVIGLSFLAKEPTSND